ncbi:hypothetical protein SAMN03159316_0934 [Pseudomonas sp. NFR02]|uniref:hypothetical protein n=1 Tax=Pseudomonas sp. NFR02 TaxID=1566229 RepID=UPI000913A66B|nr:hypothetical protein [Pseudomonas sp. NFR02]SFX15940.1 hypothetical protein SAMN03159316_0934 [Pseudomonas sp. NFR02]
MSDTKAFGMPGNLMFVSVESLPDAMLSGWQREIIDPNVHAEVADRTGEFLEQVCGYEMHDLLGLTALFTFTKAVIKDGHKSDYPEQADLEALQALMLGCQGDGQKVSIPRESVSGFWLELMRQNYVVSHSAKREGQSVIETLADSQIAYYRNPYGDEFFDRMMVEVTAEYDNRYLRDESFSSVGKLFVCIRTTIWERFQRYYRELVAIHGFSRKRMLSEVSRYKKLVEVDEDDYDWHRLSVDQLRCGLRNLIEDYTIKTLFLLDQAWVASVGFEDSFVRETLDKLSLNSLEGVKGFDGLSRFNPIASRPFIKSAKGYSIYCLMTLMSLPFSSLLTLLVDKPDAKNRIEKVRGWFAEREAARMLLDAFPSAKHVPSGYWFRSKEDRVESDLIVLVSRHVLIFEAKGALITDRVRSGAVGAVQQFLKKTWGKSTLQGAALADHLRSSTEPVCIEDAKGKVLLTLDPKEIRTVSRFSVSLEQVGLLMNAPNILRELKIIDNDIDPAPCIILSELQQVLGALKDELHRLHYLTRRFAVCRRNQIIGDEMDIFSIYLRTGFVGLQGSDEVMMILGASYELSEYRKQDGVLKIPKDSALRNSPFFDSFLALMLRRMTPAYFEVGLLLLDIPFESQRELVTGMKRVFVGTPKEADSPIIFSTVEGLLGEFAICGIYMDRNVHYAQRREMAMNVLGSVGSANSVAEGFAFVRLNKSTDAYDALYYGGQLFAK